MVEPMFQKWQLIRESSVIHISYNVTKGSSLVLDEGVVGFLLVIEFWLGAVMPLFFISPSGSVVMPLFVLLFKSNDILEIYNHVPFPTKFQKSWVKFQLCNKILKFNLHKLFLCRTLDLTSHKLSFRATVLIQGPSWGEFT